MSRERPGCRAARGFTFIEVLIVIVIVAVLAAIALPAYFGQVRKSRRSEAIAAMSQVQQAQERWRANNASYGTAFVVNSGNFAGVAASGSSSLTTSGGYYVITMPAAASGAGGTAYNVLAAAQGGQIKDTPCTYLQMAASGGNVAYTSGTTSALSNSSAENAKCWRR